ncbi:MAG: hypothetical protein WC512_04060, partial [Candidatus Omnitrophota bacterium]
ALSRDDLVEGRGYESFENYKWIKDPVRLKAMQGIYEEIAWYRPQRDERWHGKLRNLIAYWRFKTGYFGLVRLEKGFFDMLSSLKRLLSRGRAGVA